MQLPAKGLRRALVVLPVPRAPRVALLLSLALVGMVAGLSGGSPKQVSAAVQTGDCTPVSSWPANNDGASAQVMSLINQHRAALGLGQLASSPSLSASAVWKARQMAATGAFGHDDVAPPVTRSVWDRIATCGYGFSAGENIAEGFPDAQSVVNAWLGSAGHKQNIEDPSYVVTGVGSATASNGMVYWVQDFGVAADGGSPPPPPPPPPTTTTTPPPPPTTTSAPPPPTTVAGPPPTPAPVPAPAPTALGLSTLRVTPTVRSHRLVLTTRVVSSGQPVTSANVKCAATLGKRRLRVLVNAFRSGRAHCAWRLPSRVSTGSYASGWVRVRHGAAGVVQAFAVRL